MHKTKIILARTAGVGLALALVLVVCGCGGGGGGGGPQADTTAPTITGASATPTTLQPVGEDVTIQATVTDNVGVTSVTATVTPPTGSAVDVTMTKGAGDTWTGTWQTATQAKGAGAVYTIVITARDAANNTRTSSALTVTVEGPPPNP